MGSIYRLGRDGVCVGLETVIIGAGPFVLHITYDVHYIYVISLPNPDVCNRLQ